VVSERQWTEGLVRIFPPRGTERVGLGDDAAVVPNAGPESVLCCDPVIEGVHFATGTAMGLVGRKAVNRNLADLAAMGAVPDWLLLSVILPRDFPSARRRQLFEGVQRAAARADCTVVGGDVAVHDGGLIVTVTAVGHCPGEVLTRTAARPGDTIHVTGALGGSGVGDRHLRFEPPLTEGVKRGRARQVGACIDVSDGLVIDLATVLRASGDLGAVLDGDRIPCSEGAHRAAAADGRSALEHALRDGEDHVLLFTLRPGAMLPAHLELPKEAREPIGAVRRGSGIRLREGGRERPLRISAGGWQHAL